ncbi:MAG: translational GTPase TypA [Myxococcales bacterium]|nr:translational GTPase TypA [Myxococcota bacterium]MDW8284212.1 translational GTPase TypA [Myxococcales bacterium]
MPPRSDVRNIAIVAHVDHGKTTLVDALLKQAGAFRPGEVVHECALDYGELERERGITIVSKCTAITWRGTRINIVDTPGHADFGGEVERVLRMVDSVLLLVDAFEGPLPQTRFVTRKALALGLCPIVVINKIDRSGCNPRGTVDAVFDLFCALGASDAQLDFPVIFASGRHGYAVLDPSDPPQDLGPLLDLILERVPPPEANVDQPLCMQVATLDYDDYLGYVGIGRILSGRIATGDRLLCVHKDGQREIFRVQKLLAFQGLRRFEVAESLAGDIVAVTGMAELSVGETITSIEEPRVLPPMAVDEPTITMQLMANNGPFAGTEGRFVTTRNLRERLLREVKSNVALRVEDTDQPDTFRVSGRGELHLSVLIETMRREGYELCVSQPQVIFQEAEDGSRLEPYEDLIVDVDEGYAGIVIEKVGRRGGRLREMGPAGPGRTRMEFLIPSRGLIGYRSEFLTDTRGTGLLNHAFREYGPYAGPIKGRQNGVLIAQEAGETNTYALFYLQERGTLFLGPGEKVYGGQIIGMHSRDNDLVVNPSRAKKLTNIRTTAADEKLFLTPPRIMTLEAALEFINDDELVEVTPKAIRLRKRILDHSARKRAEKAAAAE